MSYYERSELIQRWERILSMVDVGAVPPLKPLEDPPLYKRRCPHCGKRGMWCEGNVWAIRCFCGEWTRKEETPDLSTKSEAP